jgi:hypothetical protein
MGEQHFLGEFESRHGLFSGHSGKVVKELIERGSFSEIIKQRLDWHTSANKHGRPA